eukprot:TRINITY_DN386_c0_g1_i5.p1 TRINITY_DN386_c0_g1~~TRINITY_DN386_c0_g1_i5.p1  ORF type:complete len:140 (+),score=31.65 TRINITY_DN386_c0_g1_i5:184-603(+)
MERIFDVMGVPTEENWELVKQYPYYGQIATLISKYSSKEPIGLKNRVQIKNKSASDLLHAMLKYDPNERITAEEALKHPFFEEQPLPNRNVFEVGSVLVYPERQPNKIIASSSSHQHLRKNKQGQLPFPPILLFFLAFS